jgi:hypothetical protein
MFQAPFVPFRAQHVFAFPEKKNDDFKTKQGSVSDHLRSKMNGVLGGCSRMAIAVHF